MNKVPILLYSGTSYGPETEDLAASAGANAFLSLPFDKDKFHSVVREILEGGLIQSVWETLVATADSGLRREIERAFNNSGFTISFAMPSDAGKEIEKRKPPIVVLDMRDNPQLAGLTNSLLDAEHGTRVIVVAADLSNAAGLMRAGVEAIIPAPPDADYLLELCRRSQSRRSIAALENRMETHAIQHREEETRYRLMFAAMLESFLLCEVLTTAGPGRRSDTRVIDINPAFEKLAGLKRERIIGRPLAAALPDSSDFAVRLEEVATTGKSAQFSTTMGRSGIPVDISAFSPKPRQFAALMRDVTERRRAEEALTSETQRLQVTLQSIGDGVIALNSDGKVVLFNTRAELITGFSSMEAIGRDYKVALNLVSQSDSVPLSIVEPLLGGGEAISADGVAIGKSGNNTYVHVSGAPIRDRNGKTAGIVITLRDMTERRQIQAAHEKSERLELMGLVAGGIAHEFNNILMVIMGSVSLTREMAERGATMDLTNSLNDAEQAAVEAKTLIHQMLTFAKEGSPIRQAVHMQELITQAVKFITRGSQIKYSLDIAPDLWLGNVDAGQVCQIIQNIVMNAIQAMPGGGDVKIKATNHAVNETEEDADLAAGEYILVSIADNGPGIAPEMLPRIFEPYFTTKPSGSGLGLATSYSIVRRHGGHIAVRSTFAKGTTFDIYLPATKSSIAATDIPARPEARERGKILVMDDDEGLQRLLARMLGQAGYDIQAVTNGADAIEFYRKAFKAGAPFDVVLMDLTIPGNMSAKQTIMALRQLDPGVCAIISTGRSADPLVENWKENGFSGVALKPFGLLDLQGLIAKVLALKKTISR